MHSTPKQKDLDTFISRPDSYIFDESDVARGKPIVKSRVFDLNDHKTKSVRNDNVQRTRPIENRIETPPLVPHVSSTTDVEYGEDHAPVDNPEITTEMREYSFDRTTKHKARVMALGEKLGFNFDRHDHTKFSDELMDQYVLIDNSYRSDLDPKVLYTASMAYASFQHIKQEPHHPEYWDDTVIAMSNQVEQYGAEVDAIVNATSMSVPALCEMVCDWVAMSLELDSSPIEWADSVIGERYEFTNEQQQLIYSLISTLWGSQARADEVELESQYIQKEQSGQIWNQTSI